MVYRKWADNDLVQAVKISHTVAGVLRILGYKTNNSGNYQTVENYMRRLNLDTSHFYKLKFGGYRKRYKTSEILTQNSDYLNSQNLKHRLIKEKILIYNCYNCGINKWHGHKLSLQIDHVNGDRTDNRAENLRLLCPNCHSLTPTFCRGRNRKKIHSCNDCGSAISKKAFRCRNCDSKLKTGKNCKIEWPNNADLVAMIKCHGYVTTGKILGVSDNAVRKHLK